MFHCCDSSPRAWSRWLLLQLPGPWPKDRSKWVPGTWSSQLRFIDGLEGLGVTPLGGITARAPSIPTNGGTEETRGRGTAAAIKARRTPSLFGHLLPWSNSRPSHKLPAPMARAKRGVGRPHSSSAAAESGPSTRGWAAPRGRGIRGRGGRGGRGTAAPLPRSMVHTSFAPFEFAVDLNRRPRSRLLLPDSFAMATEDIGPSGFWLRWKAAQMAHPGPWRSAPLKAPCFWVWGGSRSPVPAACPGGSAWCSVTTEMLRSP